MRVLLVVEASESSKWAVQSVVSQMQQDNADVSILQVIPKNAGPEKAREAREYTARIEVQLRQAGFKAVAAVEEGDARGTVVGHASRWKADLVVVGSDERTAFSRFLAKSNADHIARQSKCSVQVVRTLAAQSRILLIVDESEVSTAAVRQLIAQHKPQTTEVLVLHLIDPLPLLADGFVWESDVELAAARQEQYRTAASLTGRAAKTLRDAGFQVETAIEKYGSKNVVMDLARAWHAKLVMLGCRNEGAVDLAPCSIQITRVQSEAGRRRVAALA